MEGKRFGQKVPPLSVYLKDVLDKYPEGGQILKELVQNADDAGASKVVFLYDKSQHAVQTLLPYNLEEFQGPALYAFNDAVFQKDDWDNIQQPQHGNKVEDLEKVGRFGLGFISVFHLTDMPCIISDGNIAFFDPLEKCFGSGSPGKMWDLSADLFKKYPNQFSPFLIDLPEINASDGCNLANLLKGKFKGTLFRFPLRMNESPGLSMSTFKEEGRVNELLDSFQRDADISLLFLNHVKSITVYERQSLTDKPRPIFKVLIQYEDGNRLNFFSQIAAKRDCQTVNCAVIKKQLGPTEKDSETSRYITANLVKRERTSAELSALINDGQLKLLPWMGVAFQVGSPSHTSDSQQRGRVFCFLPLPESERTGLPVHVHGYFGLGDNRRSIKWPDSEILQDKKAQWNQLIVTEIFPEVYAQVILSAIEKSRDQRDPLKPIDVYNGWPCVPEDKINWQDGIKAFLKLVTQKAVFYTDCGSWKKPSDDVYVNSSCNPLLAKVLKRKQCPVVHLPEHVEKSLEWAGIPYKKVTPELVKNRIRGDPLQFLTKDEKLELLEYVIGDDITDLTNLCLLPLQNSTFTSFSKNVPTVYIATDETPSSLIPNGGSKFAGNLPEALLVESTGEIERHTQLRFLSEDDVSILVKEMLPGNWRNGKESAVRWTPNVNMHPSLEWVDRLWEWLRRNRVSLDQFYGIPLIPLNPECSQIARLHENKMIFKQGLSENICSFLRSAGVVVVEHDLPWSIRNHPEISYCIKSPTSEGVMALLEAAHLRGVDVPNYVKRLTRDGKEELRELLAQQNMWNLTYQPKEILMQLPFFMSHKEQYIAANNCSVAVPDDYYEIPVKIVSTSNSHIILLRCRSDEMALSLGVRKLSVSEVLKRGYLPAVLKGLYNNSDSLKIMKWVLERQEFDDLVRELKFVPVSVETKKSPSELFEPTETLQVLFKDNGLFPGGEYSTGRLLGLLRRIGLKTEDDVTTADLLKVAEAVSKTKTGQADVRRGTSLLEFINQKPHLVFESVTRNMITKELWKFLEDLYWIPCHGTPPEAYPVSAGWAGNVNTLYQPRQVGLMESSLLQGSVVPLIKPLDIHTDLNVFGWNENLDPENYNHVDRVVQHLKNVANHFQANQETYAFSHCVCKIYAFLDKVSDTHITEIFSRHLGAHQPWVWHGSGFTIPDKVALTAGTLGVNLVPYLHIIPDEMQTFQSFFAKRGVEQTFQESALCSVLLSIKDKHKNTRFTSVEDYERDLNLVCNILKYIVRHDIDVGQKSSIWVPCRVAKENKRLVMACASECLYVDEERLAKQLVDFNKPVMHEMLSNDVAHHLRLQPLSHVIAPVESVSANYEIAGPHESTVNAIKRNLDMYKEGVDIFRELIQNADDAGATEVKFLIDWRTNKDTAHDLISNGMKDCHGPALWAYNNARFTDDDINNILSIGAQSKRLQLDKVGRFGLGFTSVYHLTDVPSVVSGPYVLICDPRTIHLGDRVNPGQPGIKLDLRKESHQRTLKTYPNQFHPYRGIFGCDLPNSFDYCHTLFRLPLRTLAEADSKHPNQLSDSIYESKSEVDKLVETLKKSLATLLLFTQNVTHVSMFEIQSDSTDILNMTDAVPVLSVNLSLVQQMPRSISESPDVSTERNLLRATRTYMENKNDSTLSVPETTMIVKVTHETPTAKSKSKHIKKDQHFIVSSCMATNKVLEMALSPDGKKAGVLPCGGVAAKLTYSGTGLAPDGDTRGQLYSYLPLDVSTGLRFHANGSFLLQPNRRQLWSKPSSSQGDFETCWNVCFMESVLCKAFVNMLLDLQDLQDQKNNNIVMVDARNFQSLWPRWPDCESDFYPFVHAFYQNLSTDTCKTPVPALIFNHNQWVSVHSCFFTDWNESDPGEVRNSVKALLTAHQKYLTTKHNGPKGWVELDPEVVDSIDKAGARTCFKDNTFSIKRFLDEIFFHLLRSNEYVVPCHRNVIVLHVMDLRLGGGKVRDYDNDLKETECIPTSPDGEELASPNDLVKPESFVGELYTEEDGRFPYGDDYRTEAHLLSMMDLGMSSDDLLWKDVCDRAEFLSREAKFNPKSVVLLKLMDKKLGKKDNPTPEERERIRAAAFLPVLKKPKSYPAEWYTSGCELMSANELYEAKFQHLLGSVQPLLDEEKLGCESLSNQVKYVLGLDEKKVPVDDVIQQLEILVSQTKEITQEVSAMVYKMYEFLQETVCVSGGHTTEVKHEYLPAVQQLTAVKFVLCEKEFQSCNHVVFNYGGKSGPYLYEVSPMLKNRYGDLLKACLVKDEFDVADFLETLQTIKEKYQDKPLQEADLATAKEMISHISKMVGSHDDDRRQCLLKDGIFVPDKDGILRTPSELTINDMNWKGSTNIKAVYTHSVVTLEEARIFGIVSQREKEVASCSPFKGFKIKFGQKEELTERLRNILRSYPNVSDVFKELLQNADDAGSTEIHFVYDPRSHQTEKVIGESWEEIQKLPAICVYNNKPFSRYDIEGIQKVGIGGKREDISTTGKFGIGFNAVYHLTDCPSFLSGGHTLCVFDPLLKYVPGIQKESPGIQLEAGEQFRETFPDMLRGYLEDMEVFGQQNGTMFRIPLRKYPSKISGEVFYSFKVKELIEDFQKVSEEALLFLNNINKITISHVDVQTGKLIADYHIRAELSQEDQKVRQELADHLKLFNENSCESVEAMSRVYSLTTEDSREVQQKWLISTMVGFVDLPSDQDISNDAGLKKPVPRGGVAAQMSSTKVGRNQAVDKFRAYCCLPLPIITQLPVHVNGTFELDDARRNLVKGKDFVHGDAGCEDAGLIHKWNRLLLKNVIPPAYAHLLLNAGRKILDPETTRPLETRESFDRLFPKDLKVLHGEWSVLAKATLCYIGQKNLEVLPVVRNNGAISWHHPNSVVSLAFFDNLSLRDHEKAVQGVQKQKEGAVGRKEEKAKDSDVLRSFLHDVGFNLLASSQELCSAFQDSGIEAESVTPKSVVQHLLATSECTSPSGLPSSLKETAFKKEHIFKTVFSYCLEGITSPVELNGLPLRLTSDGVLNEFSTTDGLYLTKHCQVLPCLRELFLHPAIVKMCCSHFKKNENLDQSYSCGIFKEFTISELAHHLDKQLPDCWKDCKQHVEWTPGRNDQQPEPWLRYLWAFILDQVPNDESPLSLEPISNWPIFPTTSGKLVPPSLSKTVLYFPPSFETPQQQKLATALRGLVLPEIAWDKMCNSGEQPSKIFLPARKIPVDLEQMLKEQVALPTKQADVTSVIQFTMHTSGPLRDPSPEDSDTLLKFFQEEENISEKSIQTIKQLPLFTLQGKGGQRTDLQQVRHYHTTMDYCIPDAENQKWKDQMRCAFLKLRPQYTLIYEQLGITQIGQADIYLEYILPCFKLLSEEVQLQHIEFISKLKHASEAEEGVFLEELKLFHFIPDAEGCFHRAHHFYDPCNPVFKAMIPKNKLLPGSITKLGVRPFLKKIGFHTKVSQDDFFTFANEIENRAKKNVSSDEYKKLMKASELLTGELDDKEDLCDPNFLQKISKVKFIPSVPISAELLEIFPAFQTESNSNHKAPFIGYQGSVPEKHLELVWSVAPVLPYWAVPHRTQWDVKGVKINVTKFLGIDSGATLGKVLSHTQNVCGMMEQKNAFDAQDKLSTKVRGITKEVMQKILEYLSKNVHKHGQEIKRRLQHTPICQVEEGRVFVRADQIVFKMERDDLRPYLYSAPRDLGAFDEVFKLLGAKDFCTFEQLAGVLTVMKSSYGNEVLRDPNEKIKAQIALSQIFNILIKCLNERKPCEVSVTEFYLLTSEYRLRKSTELYYADPNLMEQLKLVSTDKEFVFPLTQCGFNRTDEVNIIRLLPENIRPKNLGDDMMERPCDTNIDCPAGQHCEYIGHVKRMLNSEEMTRVLERLAKHQMESKQSGPSPKLAKCVKELQTFDNFACKTELQLGFYDVHGNLLAKQNVQSKAYFDQTGGQILLQHQWPLKKHMSVTFKQIARCCNALVGRLLDSDHLGHLQTALDSPSPNEMNISLTEMRIPEYDTTTRAIQQDNYELGAAIPLDIRHLLDRDLRNRFNEGDIVGYERPLDDIAAAERVLDFGGDGDVGPEAMLLVVSTPVTEATEIIYAKIISQIGENEEPRVLSQEYSIDIGQAEPITVSMTALYKFRPPKISPEQTVAVSTMSDSSAHSAEACSGSHHSEDLQEAKEQIKKQVREAFTFPKDEQKRVIHRLYFTWHPDKNPEQQEICTEAFKFLSQEIERQDATHQYRQRYSAWDAEMKREREEAKRYQERCSENPNISRQNRSDRSYVPPSFTKETPDPRTARVWFRQAKEHLKAANQTSSLDPAWIAFKVHQAAETALKAAQYSLVGRPDASSNDLISLARQVDQQHGEESRKVQWKVHALVRLQCDFTRPRYPQNKETSGQAYQDFSSQKAFVVCQELLDLVQGIIGINVF